MASKCLLHCLKQLHEPILLSHGQELIIGRSVVTKIKDKRCSKKQVKLIADYQNYSVKVTQIGSNASAVFGKPLFKGSEAQLRHEEIIELLLGHYPHKVEFYPLPNEFGKANVEKLTEEAEVSEENCSLKRKRKSDLDSDGVEAKMPRLPLPTDWESFDDGGLLVYNCNGVKGSQKIAAYDMDGTLITTKSGLVFPRDDHDWRILYSEVPGKLKSLQQHGYKIVIFTNQAGIGTRKQSASGIKSKIIHLIKKLGITAQVFVSTGRTKYRKPIPGMWDFFVSHCNDGIDVNKEESVYVGDAAGRPEIKKIKKKDHSNADRLFALNICLPFATPEEHFQGTPASAFTMPEFSPVEAFSCARQLYDPPDTRVPAHPLEVILLVGFPGAGKSSFVENHLTKLSFVAANRDSLGTWQKCVSLMEKSLKERKHVVIDNTNPDVESRRRYVTIAKKLNVPIRCFVFNASKTQAKHNNKFRELIDSKHSKVSEMIFNSYNSKYQEPKLSEGFSDIVKINLLPRFKQKKHEDIYKLYLLEK